ncbi:sensor domain-containing protein [Halostella litorea]|uniref:sensor domain-containing protein n=1 Tax=Halostella litorea TaxID=2528831 RepID=UPI001092C345|nr:sensor domain-containing protein [Halostella litorea]
MSLGSPSSLPVRRPTVRSVVGVPFRAQTYKNLLYLALAFPLGLAYFIALSVGLSVSLAAIVLVVGVPLTAMVLVCAVGVARFEGILASVLLGVDIDTPDRVWLQEEGLWRRAAGLFFSVNTWKAVLYLASKLIVGIVSFVLLLTLFMTSGTMMAVPLFYDQPGVHVGLIMHGPVQVSPSLTIPWDSLLVGVETVVTITSWEVTTLPQALLMSLLGCCFLLAAMNVTNAFAWVAGRYAQFMLGEASVNPIVDEAA